MTGSPARLDVFVSVVAPVVDDWPRMSAFVTEACALLRRSYANYELVLVDSDAGEDVIGGLMGLLREVACVRVVRLSRAAGHEVMFFAGLEAAIGDHVVLLTPGVDPPAAVTDLVGILTTGRDIVRGISRTPVRRSPVGRLGATAFDWYCRRYLGLRIPPNSTEMVALNRRSINALTRTKGRYRHVRHLSLQVGFKTELYHYTPGPGKSAGPPGIRESVRLAREIVVSYSHHPLRGVSLLGLVVGLLNLARALYLLAADLLDPRAGTGHSMLSLEVAVLFVVLFAVVAVVCEYLGRVLEEIRGQPAYHIMEELNSTVLVADENRRNVLT